MSNTLPAFETLLQILDVLGSQKELADLLNLAQPNIAMWKNGERPIPRKHLKTMREYIDSAETLDRSTTPDLSLLNLVNLAKENNVPIHVTVHLGDTESLVPTLTH